MDQPFHPSIYLHRLRKRWYLIVIPVVVALVFAILISIVTPVKYTSTTTLTAPNPRLVWRWEGNLYDFVDWRFDWLAEVMSVAESEAVADRALELTEDQLQNPISQEELLAATDVRELEDRLITISVTAADADDTFLLANAMVQALLDVVDDVYWDNQEAYDAAIAEATAKFNEWDQKLVDFRAETGVNLGFSGDLATTGDNTLYGIQSSIKQELTLKNSDRAALKNALDRIDLVLASLEDDTSPEHLALLDLPELNRYGLSFAQLQALAVAENGELSDILQSTRTQLQSDYDILEELSIALQQQHAEQLSERDQILMVRGQWQDSVKNLRNKQMEEEIRGLVEEGRVTVMEEAELATEPSQPNWPINIGLALVAGLFGGLLLAIVVIYLGDSPE